LDSYGNPIINSEADAKAYAQTIAEALEKVKIAEQAGVELDSSGNPIINNATDAAYMTAMGAAGAVESVKVEEKIVSLLLNLDKKIPPKAIII